MTMQDFIVVGAGTLVLFVVFMVIGYVREYGAGDLWGVLRRYVEVRVTSSEGDAGAADDARSGAWGDAGAADDLRRWHTHQVNSGIAPENAAGQESIVLRQLPKTELIVMLAVQRKEDGSYLWSSNDIKKFVPGTDGPIGDIIATVRGKKPVDPPSRSIRKGANGEWEPVK